MTFPYQALDSSQAEIRVIRMSSQATDADNTESPISITLHTVSLDDPRLKYHALSYVWGDSSDTVTIMVDGIPFSATANLATALQSFRPSSGGDPDFLLWVDAVCINQGDKLERKVQVELMGRIYRQTQKVLVWLGPGEERDDVRALCAFLDTWSEMLLVWLQKTGSLEIGPQLLTEFDRTVKTALGKYRLRLASSEEIGETGTDIAAASTKFSNESASQVIDPINTLFEVFRDRPYWSRIWTFQELQLPKEGVFLCGHDAVVGLNEIKRVFLWFNDFGPQLMRKARPEQISPEVWRVLCNIVAVISSLPLMKQISLERQLNMRSSSHPLTVIEILRATQFRRASNPRDLYYGLLGVVELPGLKVDYDASAEQVLTGASKLLCTAGGELLTYLLCYAGTAAPHWSSFTSLPSWVTTRGIIQSMFQNEIFWSGSYAGRSNEASLPYTEPTILDDVRTLLCEGIIVDTIAEKRVKSILDDIPEGGDSASRHVDESASFFFDCAPGHLISDLVASGMPYIGGGTQFAALVRLWMQDHLRGSYPLVSFNDILDSENLESNLEFMDAIHLFLVFCCLRDRDFTRLKQMMNEEESVEQSGKRILRVYKFIVKGFTKSRSEASPEESGATEATPTWDDVLYLALRQRRAGLDKEEVNAYRLNNLFLEYAALFRTKAGYIGTARPGIQRGDKLCVLAGASVPVILRPVAGEGFYQLVSYAFATGLMHGEAWRMVERGERETNFFLIK
jgi:hypothetical protein